jgi:hypothetical protein
MLHRSTRALALLGALLLPLAACDDATGPAGQTEVLLSQGTTAAASLSSTLLAENFAAPVSLSQVASIEVVITGVQVLPAEEVEDESEDDADDGAWIPLALVGAEGQGVRVDLLQLPTSSAVTLATAELEAGSYENLRLFVSDATITFREPVTVGRREYPANQPLPLFIPSAEQSGIKLPQASFTVPAEGGEQVVVQFNAAASVRGINATGEGTVLLNPVLGVEERDD